MKTRKNAPANDDLDDLDDLMGGDTANNMADEDDFFGSGHKEEEYVSAKKGKSNDDPLAFLQRAQ